MPRLLLLAFVLPLAVSVQAQDGTWQLLPNSPEHWYRFEDGSFINPMQGWIVNGSGETWRTTDGGATWELRSAVGGDYHRSAAFVSETKGWIGVLFSDTQLYETNDGGATLDDVSDRIVPAVSGGICGLFAVDAQTVYGVGQYSGPAYVIKTTDGGSTWQATHIAPSLAQSLVDVYFFDAQRGLAVGGTDALGFGGRAVVLGTEDGGATWERRFVSSGDGTSSEWGWKISFPTPEIGYVSVEFDSGGPAGKVLKTTDGGQTWTEIAVPNGDSMQGVGFITPDLGWTSGRGSVTETHDGGSTWALTGELDGSVNRFEFFGDTLGYAMGTRIYRLRRQSTVAAEPDAAPTTTALVAVAPNPARGPVTATYRLERSGTVEVTVYDVLGRRVAVLDEGARAAGLHTARWDAAAAGVPPGAYVVRLTTGEGTWARPFTVLGR
ncbi:MAG TPA: T9SS type A sorting domain-containing protein [Rubricoccaceae bacterium]|nr:T9SS type A sorting domain-containing protein [Rubricoccaceae bacterium]